MMGPSQRTRTTLQRRAVSAFTTNLPLKGAALFFALVLWAIVSIEEPTEDVVEVQLEPVTADSGVVVKKPLPHVQALIVGRGRDLFRLAANPPVIRTLISAEAPETLTVRLTPEMVDLPVDVNARVREVLPRSVTLRLDLLAERMVPVASLAIVRADSGMVLVGTPRLTPDSVMISGPRSVVEQLDSVFTRRMIVPVADSLPRVVPLDTARLGVRVTPSRVAIRARVVRTDTAAVDSTAVPDSAAPPAP